MINFELDVEQYDYLIDLLDDVAETISDTELEKIVRNIRAQADAQ